MVAPHWGECPPARSGVSGQDEWRGGEDAVVFLEDRQLVDVVLTPDEIRRLGQGRSLLFIRGAFSSAHGGFGRLPVETQNELHTRYDGRVFAFDHPTVSKERQENVAWLAEQLRSMDVRSGTTQARKGRTWEAG